MNPQLESAGSEGVVDVSLSGYDLINSPRLNKGTAFPEHERDIFDLHGLLPPHVGDLDEQVRRRMQALAEQPTAFSKYAFLREVGDEDALERELRANTWEPAYAPYHRAGQAG